MKDKPSTTSRVPLVICVMMATSMIAIEATIVSTAMPQMVAQLGGVQYYTWVFSAFLLTQTASTVIVGKLADQFGYRPNAIAGVSIFLVGSLLCGFAGSMPVLIAYRLVQGAGAGAMQAVAVTLISDLFPGRERGRIQGYLASQYAFASVIGPVLGGLISRHASWAWIFWMNLPIGLFAAAGFIKHLPNERRRRHSDVDLGGGILATLCIALLMIALTEASTSRTGIAAAAAVGFIGCLWAFVRHEQGATDPIISFRLWKRRPIALANLSNMFATMALMGLTSFLPMYMQFVLHQTAISAGLALAVMMVGWPLGATIAARAVFRTGPRPLLRTGSVLVPCGACVFVLLDQSSSPTMAAAGSFVMGFGMGLISSTSIIMIQAIVQVGELGSATASTLFARNLGSTLGAALSGAAFNIGLSAHASSERVTSSDFRSALELGGMTDVSPSMQVALQHALHGVFLSMVFVSMAIVVVALLAPPTKLEGVGGSSSRRQSPKHRMEATGDNDV